MRKSQIDQVFVIIFGVIVIAFVLIYGSYVIVNTINTSNKVDNSLFFDNIKNSVKRCYNLDVGSTCDLSIIKVPQSLLYICFINPGESIDYNSLPKSLNETIRNYMKANSNSNVFITDSKNNLGFLIDNLKSSTNPLCDRLSDIKINLVLENKGTYVQVRP